MGGSVETMLGGGDRLRGGRIDTVLGGVIFRCGGGSFGRKQRA